MKTYMTESINKILAEWDPIGVGHPICNHEYRQYIPEIIQASSSQEKLELSLAKIINNLGLDFDTNDLNQRKEINEVAEKIIKVVK